MLEARSAGPVISGANSDDVLLCRPENSFHKRVTSRKPTSRWRACSSLETTYWSGLFGNFVFRKNHASITNDDDNQPNGTRTTIIFQPPKWLVELGLRYEINVCLHGTMGSFETYRIVAWGAPILQYCREGNIEGVRELLSTGQASVWDIDEHGNTTLHVRSLARPHYPI